MRIKYRHTAHTKNQLVTWPNDRPIVEGGRVQLTLFFNREFSSAQIIKFFIVQ